MRLLLIRHGQTPSNLGHFLDTALPGPGLTDLGVRQASALPRALAGEDIASLYASTLTRTQLTAAPLAAERGIDVRVRDGIRELSAGDLEMRADEDAVRQYLTTAFGWSAGDIARRMPGGENGTEALARFDAVVAEAAGAGERSTVALVSHGAAIRVWTAARARNVTVGFAAEHRLENTGVVVVEGSPASGWTALSWAGTVVPGVTASGAADAGPAGRTLRGPKQEPPAGPPSD
ncbi:MULTISPECIES: histidine phosphatase family protein [Streptomyces]|uniref:Phosphoglycerate mutase n=1 Tax=Streptomyces griseus subsp. griseus (strain JCM 4626 / CBS 651.72 / NBRC 13350 / KCC S-0626 / ISP 5235) TaxID=455632 RepID=B1VQ60_STRGG|nr:histidine phosphatase family protein [Streptomyces griseus]MBW3702787.1 histidine phosphatase family protein [Streptomyces griseus]BAG17161.1 putative phosphoglycerate mutase [Streptomyces griseus subsp. griseus NBRC 13350]SED79747.1 probable phosphoglycerate mutase [Streptomyces griseus]SQA21055.1 phosphoglycerate mutase [Streptomyces griseus]